jgi:crotonobetainyl-CoA:carnitine CoA-transferase CaiB-like acyl-CoA transferase
MTATKVLPLEGILVLDFSQFLAGPVAALRLADLGARVIKIERPGVGDIGRTLAFAGRTIDGDTVSFHAMNRNKESVTADLKSASDLAYVKQLVARADVIIQNFRPGVMERIGLDYEAVRELNPTIVYASATGYGTEGPWRDRPGQDLLAQSISGLPWLNGSRDDGPVPVGLSIADHLLSCHLAQGVPALLVRRFRTGEGGLVESSLLESALDLQFELLSTRLNDDSIHVRRGGEHSAHAFLAAP